MLFFFLLCLGKKKIWNLKLHASFNTWQACILYNSSFQPLIQQLFMKPFATQIQGMALDCQFIFLAVSTLQLWLPWCWRRFCMFHSSARLKIAFCYQSSDNHSLGANMLMLGCCCFLLGGGDGRIIKAEQFHIWWKWPSLILELSWQPK